MIQKIFLKKTLQTIVIMTGLILIYPIQSIQAQIFPVQANIHVAPPYSVYLSQYTASDQEKIMATILLRDPVIPSIDVKFRFTVEGGGIKLSTNPAWNPQPYTLTAGISTMLPQDLIADYLKPQNLLIEGVDPQEFYRSGRLPEGFYEFKIEVVEYRRNIAISNLARTGLWLLLSEPPRISYPLPNQKIKATNPQMLNFTWMSGGISSPGSSMNIQYEFTLVELTDKSVDPTVAITTASIATKFVKVLDQTNLLYGPGEMPLTPGKSYAIRVKAFNSDGIEMFKNGGYSPVSVFTFGDACLPPVSFTLESPTQSTFNINVVTDPGNTKWQAHLREKNASAAGADLQSVTNTSNWSELIPDAGSNSKTPKGLKASTAYEVQIKGLCGDVPSDFTQSKTITTKPMADPNRTCSSNPTPFAADNASALQQLKVDDIFLAALFPIRVKAMKSQAGGKFSGSGIATLPLFNTGLAVTFDNVGINEKMQLTSGEVKVVRNELNLTIFGDTPPPPGHGPGDNGNNPNDTTKIPPITNTITIPVCDSLVVVNDSTVIVYPPSGGTPVTVNLGGNSCTLLVPADGNMDNAKVVYDGAAHPYSAENGKSGGNGQNKYNGFLAHFLPNEGQIYGYDSMRFIQHTSFYQEMELNHKIIKLPWKALEQGKSDLVTLNIQRSSTDYPYTNLKVGPIGGAEIIPFAGGDTPKRTYRLLGKSDGDQEAIVATYKDSSKTKYAGGIWTATYNLKPFKLFLVPVGGITIADVDRGTLQQNLNTKIFSQAVVTWTVGTLPGLTGVELGDNGLDWADNSLLSSYDPEMNSVISAFKAWKPNADPDAYYLFIIPKFSESGVEGFMPRNRRFGFVTLEQLKDRTVAHELGHGAFNLRHTFPEVPQGNSKNLMDYSDGIDLYKPQWDLIHNPEFTTGLWDNMEDGAAMSLPCLAWFDDCDNVLNILEKFRNARINESNIKIKGQTKTDESILIASLIKVGETDYKKIRLIYKQKTEDFSFDPIKYNAYDQQFFLADGSVDRQRGFVYYENSKELFKIIVDDEDNKIESLKEYLFGSGIRFEVKSNGKPMREGCYVKIDSIPEMPDIKVKNTSASDVLFRLKIEYRRDIRSDEDFFPEREWKTVKANEIWTIDFGNKIRGGKATLLYKTGNKEFSFSFHIRASNPTEQEIKNYISDQGYDIWFLTRLIRQESGYHQFNVGTNFGPNWTDVQGCPNHGDPHGWGLMQLDVIGGTRENPLRPTVQELWDWKANLRRGVQFIENDKFNSVNRHFEDEMEKVGAWNDRNADNSVLGHADQIEGNITYTHSKSGNFDYDFGAYPVGNNHSFMDATWIKNYNGSSGGTGGYPGFYYVLKQIGTSRPYWDLQRINSNNHNYVEAVSSRNP